MQIVTFQFLFFLVFSSILLQLPLKYPSRDVRLLAINLIFVTNMFADVKLIVSGMLFISVGYLSLYVIKYFRSTWVMFITIILMVSIFIWLKQYTTLLPSPYIAIFDIGISTIGLSYLLFRILHLIVDFRQGMLEFPSIIRFFNYCLFFPCFLSGPIQKYQSFNDQMLRPLLPLSVCTLSSGIASITKGLVLTFVVSGLFQELTEWGQANYYQALTTYDSIRWLTLAAIFYLVNLYTNFSGYMHIVIGAGAVCGFNIPENFNKPYLSTSFLELWSRWHITLSDWFKNYLFNPMLKLLISRWDDKKLTPYFGALAFFITFFVMGLWHGSTRQFAVYGFLLGFGAFFNKVWQIYMMNVFGKKKSKDLAGAPLYQCLGNAITLGYFSMALVCLWLEPSKIPNTSASTFIFIWLCGMCLATFIVFTLGRLISILMQILKPLASWNFQITQLIIARWNGALSDSFNLAIIFYILVVTRSTTPAFIYKAF